MPRKTKEQNELENNENIEKVAKKTTRKSTKKVDTSEKSSTNKRNTSSSPKATSKKVTTTKSTTTKKASPKKTSTTKDEVGKTTAKKATTKKSTTKASTTKASSKKASTKKTTIKKASSKKTNGDVTEKATVVEYYDLPYRYNQTIVKVLAQTPTNLFIYWDISDEDRENYKKQYGERFFEETKPVLIVHNKTFGYSFEIDINDFANSWYLHVNDAKCDYSIELGRRPIVLSEQINTDYIHVSTSNKIESPNDRVLFNKEQKMVYFRNVKTGEQSEKSITSLSFIRNMGRIYNIYDLYKKIYQEENIEDLFNTSNPSSGTFSSEFK